MRQFDNITKAFKSEKDNKETSNNNNSEEIQENNSSKDNNKNIKSKEEKTLSNNFTFLDQLIHSGQKEIILDQDIVLTDDEEEKYSEGIEIEDNNLIIEGNGHTIDAQQKIRIFQVTGKNITIKNITLKNGYTEENGGAIYNSEKLTLTNTILTKNITKYDGGAIFNNGTLTIQDSTLNNNTGNWGGAIFNNGTLTIKQSTLNDNNGRGGGAIFNIKTITIVASILNNNNANKIGGSYGGAIDNIEDGIINIQDSILANNTANHDGGAINNDGSLTISNSTLSNNTAKYGGGAINNKKVLKIQNTTLQENTATNGGAISSEYFSVSLNNCKFIKNISKNSGGALRCYWDYNKESNIKNRLSITCDSCDFYNNLSKNIGGTVWTNYYVNFYKCNFCDNDSGTFGNIIYLDGIMDISINIEDSLIKNNFTKNVDIYINDSSFINIQNTNINNISDNYVIYNKKGIVNISNLNYEYKDKLLIYNNNILWLDDNNIRENIISTKNSIIKYKKETLNSNNGFHYLEYLINNNSKNIILNCDIILHENEKDFYEGGIELYEDNIIFDGQNHIIDSNNLSRTFIITGHNITIKNIKFKNGYYFKYILDDDEKGGGVIYALPNTSLTIENCEFTENISRNIAGCINNKGMMNIYNSKFKNNFAQKSCGTISNYNTMNLNDCTFENNFAPLNDDNSKDNYYETKGNIINYGNIKLKTCNFNASKYYYIEKFNIEFACFLKQIESLAVICIFVGVVTFVLLFIIIY